MDKKIAYLLTIVILIPTFFFWTYAEVQQEITVYTSSEVEVEINPEHKLTYELIDLLCNKEQYNELSRIYCMNRLWIETKHKSTCRDEDRDEPSKINYYLGVLETLNTGGGCCRDAVEGYKYAVENWTVNATYIRLKKPHHTNAEVLWVDEDEYTTDYVVLDQGHFKYISLSVDRSNVSQQDIIKQDVKEFVKLYEVRK